MRNVRKIGFIASFSLLLVLFVSVAGGQTYFDKDNLADATAGRDLSAHTPSGAGAAGTSWAKHAIASSSAIVAISAGTAFRANIGGVNNLYLMAGTPGSNDYSVQADLYFASTPTLAINGIIGRASTSADTYYWVSYQDSGPEKGISLRKRIAGTDTLLGVSPLTPVAGHTYTLRLTMVGTTISAWLGTDGGAISQVVTATDSSLTSGPAGIESYNTTLPTDTTGIFFKNFSAYTGTLVSFTASPPSVTTGASGAVVSLAGSGTNWISGTTTFSVSGVTGANITAQSITDTTHASITLTTGSTAGTLTISDGTNTTTIAIVSGASFLPNNTNIFWSPGVVYFDGSNYAHVRMNATYFKTTFTGTSFGMTVDLSTNTANGLGVGTYGHWVVSVDGTTPNDVTVTGSSVTLCSGLASGTHYLQAWFSSVDETDTFTPKEEDIIQSFVLDSGATLSPPTASVALRTKRALIFGDSITKGAFAYFPGSLSSNHPLANFATNLLDGMDAEGGQVGLSGQGFTFTYNAWTTLLPNSFGKYDSTHARTWPALDYLFICEGQNDSTNDATSAVQALAATARAAVGASTWIFFCIPFSGGHSSQISAGIAAYKSANPGDMKIAILDPTTILTLTNSMTADGIHPLSLIHIREGHILAQLALRTIYGAVGTTIIKRRVQ